MSIQNVDFTDYIIKKGDIVKVKKEFSDTPDDIPFEVVMSVFLHPDNPHVYLSQIEMNKKPLKFAPQLKTRLDQIESVIYGNVADSDKQKKLKKVQSALLDLK